MRFFSLIKCPLKFSTPTPPPRLLNFSEISYPPPPPPPNKNIDYKIFCGKIVCLWVNFFRGQIILSVLSENIFVTVLRGFNPFSIQKINNDQIPMVYF